MTTTRYVALLRGINVGGRNKVPMADLRACFEKLGYRGVQTLIASGNVVFEASDTVETLTEEIERMLPARFELDSSLVRVLVLPGYHLQRIVDRAPDGFGAEPETYRYYVYFLIGISPGDAIEAFELRDGIDAVWHGDGAIYTRQLLAKLTKSRLNRVASRPVYQSMTIRNWNTTTRLLELVRERAS